MYRAIVTVFTLGAVAWSQGVPGMAVGILEQAGAARQAIAHRDKAAALDHVRRAAVLAGDIKQASSSAGPVLVPVASETSTTATWTPVKPGKDGRMSAGRMKKNTSVREVDQQTTTKLLDVTSAADRLAAAESALERDDWTAADSSLAAIPESVIETETAGTMPLLKAQRNLELARARVLEEQYEQAAAPLRAAAEALAAYGRTSPGPQARQAQSMRVEIEDFAKVVGERQGDALDRINSWLQPVTDWNQAVAQH